MVDEELISEILSLVIYDDLVMLSKRMHISLWSQSSNFFSVGSDGSISIYGWIVKKEDSETYMRSLIYADEFPRLNENDIEIDISNRQIKDLIILELTLRNL